MSVEEGFLTQLRGHPGDDTTRLVYADWLKERGDPRGEYLRGEIELARLAEGDLRSDEVATRLRVQRLGLDQGWLAQAGKRFDVWLLGYPPDGKIGVIKVIR